MIRTRISPYIIKRMIIIDLFTRSLEVRTDQVLLCSEILYYIISDLSSPFSKYFASTQIPPSQTETAG